MSIYLPSVEATRMTNNTASTDKTLPFIFIIIIQPIQFRIQFYIQNDEKKYFMSPFLCNVIKNILTETIQ